MVKSAKKVILIGLDAPIAHRLCEYARAGKLPAIARLIDNGVYAENCLVPFPTVTPPNWTTIATGAWPGTHGITSMHTHMPGEAYCREVKSFDSSQCQAEYIWDAAARLGKKSVIINYPVTYGYEPKGGIRLGGAAVWINSSVIGRPGWSTGVTLAADQVFSTDEYLEGTIVSLREASGWQNVPPREEALEADLQLMYRDPEFPVGRKRWHLLVLDTEGKGYDRAIVSEAKDAAEAFATLSVGEWSENVIQEFETARGVKRAAFRCKLMELSPDARHLRLYVTPLCALDGWSYPESVASEIPCREGLPLGVGAHFGWGAGWIDTETLVEVYDWEHRWMAETTTYLLTHKEWDLFFVVVHNPDTFHHLLCNKIDPMMTSDPNEVAYYQGIELLFYQSLDRMIESITAFADEETLVVIVSDHGTKATMRRFLPAKVLADAGLTVFKEALPGGPDEVSSREDVMDRLWPFRSPEPDWLRTKAIAIGECYIYVNLKGRDPQGIVQSGEEYERVRDEIIRALYDYTDSRTGTKPISLAVRREDARVFGLHGDRVGDVVYAINPEFGRQHGPHWPTQEIGIGSLKGLFIMAGPGVKKDCLLKRTVNLVDVVPTVCYLADLPIPRDAEGAVIYQALEDPDAKRDEFARLKDNYTRLKAIYERQRAETHSYNL